MTEHEQARIAGMLTALRLRREGLGLARWKLERELGLRTGTIARYETADRWPKLPVLIRWAEALNMHVEVAP